MVEIVEQCFAGGNALYPAQLGRAVHVAFEVLTDEDRRITRAHGHLRLSPSG
jgi:hypothetical protein